jgi:hypothetical protein
MEYGTLLSRAWNIIWQHKFLILLGVLVALGNAGGSGLSSGGNVTGPAREGDFNFQAPTFEDFLKEPGFGFAAGLVVVVIGVVLLIGVALWVVASLARGGLIAGVNGVELAAPVSFGAAWRAAWAKGWRLLGINIIPAIPLLILLLAGVGLVIVSAGSAGLLDQPPQTLIGPRLGVVVVGLVCLVLPLALILSALRVLANRACMLEDMGVFGSYRRGVRVLLDNLGPALILYLIQIGISILLGIILFLPAIVAALCCILWPLVWLVQGAIAAYFSTVWTLAWREWTGLSIPGTTTSAQPLT